MFNEDTKKKDTAAENKPMSDKVRDLAQSKLADAVSEEVTEVVIETADDDKIDMIVKLHKPLKFEGEVYDEIDMSGITNITTNKARDIEKIYRKISKGSYDASPETTINWAIAATSVVTGLPVEFFNYLNIKDLVKMKNRVINFLYED